MTNRFNSDQIFYSVNGQFVKEEIMTTGFNIRQIMYSVTGQLVMEGLCINQV